VTRYHRLVLLLALLFLLGVPARARADEHGPIPIPEEKGPGATTSEYWVSAPADGAQYSAMRQLTGFAWQANKSLFVVSESINAFQRSIVGVFAAILDVLGETLEPPAQILIVLGLILGLIFVIVRPLFEVDFASVRRGLVLVIVLPLLLPAAALAFTTLDAIRVEFSQGLYRTSFDRTTAQLEVSGERSQMGPVTAYYDDDTRRPIDVAAAYLYISRDDIYTTQADVPEAFADRFYTPPPSDWSTVGANARAAYLAQAGSGLERMVYGLVPNATAVLDAFLHATYTLGLGVLFVGLMFAICLATFGPFAAAVYDLCRTIFGLIAGSWVIAVIQGVIVAYLYRLALAGNADWVLGLSVFALLAHLVFVACACWMVLRAFIQAVAVTTPDTPDVAVAGLRTAAGAAVGGIVGGYAAVQLADRLHPSASSMAGGVMHSSMGYQAARRAGYSRRWAAGYALAPSHAVQHATAVGLTSGMVNPRGHVAKGVFTGAVTAREQPDSLRSIMSINRRAPRKQPLVPHARVNGQYQQQNQNGHTP
jgi:hypothetical protein